jgi:dolichol-phosphate mannosyltransferase
VFVTSNPGADPRPAPRLSVVVPTYNEKERLQEFVEAVLGALDRAGVAAEVVIVDDNSPDGTGALADALALRLPVTVVHRAGKLGLGSAVVAGFGVARGDVLGVMDADMSHPPESLPRLIEAFDSTGADIVVGSRYVPGGGTKNWPWYRSFMSKFACSLARIVTPVHDAASGFFLIRARVLRGGEVQAPGFKICLELLVRGTYGAVAEVPYVFADRAAGVSKMNHREALGYLVQLKDLFLWQRRQPGRTRPRYLKIPPADVASGFSRT